MLIGAFCFISLPSPPLGKHPAGHLPFSRGLREGREDGLDERLPLQPGEFFLFCFPVVLAKSAAARKSSHPIICMWLQESHIVRKTERTHTSGRYRFSYHVRGITDFSFALSLTRTPPPAPRCCLRVVSACASSPMLLYLKVLTVCRSSSLSRFPYRTDSVTFFVVICLFSSSTACFSCP